MAHVDDRVVAEIDRHVVPHARHDRDRLPDAVGLLLADRTHAPGTIAAATATVGRDGDVLAGDGERALPAAHLRESLGVEDDRAPAAQILAGSSKAGIDAVQVTSMAMSASFGSTITRSFSSGSMISTRIGPTEMSIRSSSGLRSA